ncbi:MAG: stage III sporulation protein AC [Acutalibacteraceae bacterium]
MGIELIFKIAAVGMIVAILNQLLTRSGKEEYSVLTTLAGLIAVILMLLPEITELFSAVKDLFEI